MSLRNYDMGAEQELAKFLDRCFWARLKAEGAILDWERVIDREVQLAGTDVVLTSHKGRFACDEKSTLHYLNRNIPTFAFELSFMRNDGGEACGWLLNDELATTHYVLSWPCAATDDFRTVRCEDFTEAEVMVVPKASLRRWLASMGADAARLAEWSRRLRASNCSGRIESGRREYSFYKSVQLAEVPVNVVIYKQYLAQLAKGAHYRVTRDALVRL